MTIIPYFFLGKLVTLDWDEYFSMQAYVESPGYQRMALTGFITQRRSDGVYVGSLLPQMFYGASGEQLSSWSQYLPSGQQTILSRSGGLPKVPKEEIYWRKVSDFEIPTAQPVTPKVAITSNIWIPLLGVIGGLALIYWSRR
jgi:hypothetical protein